MLLCQVVFALYILYFVAAQLVEMRRKGLAAYWRSYWALAEWAVIGLAAAAGGLYAYRYVLTKVGRGLWGVHIRLR